MDSGSVRGALSNAPTRTGSAPGTGIAGAAAGGVVAALASISCCILPLVLFSLGISGAWIANLTALEPYQPAFFAVAAGFLGVGYWLVYRRAEVVCADGSCAQLARRLVKGTLWVATGLVLAAMLFRYFAPLLLPN